MKFIKTLVYALAICMTFVSVAEAKGRASAFRSGFSSQKRSAPKPTPLYNQPAPQPAAGQAAQSNTTSFGAFGGGKANTASGNSRQSQMGTDLGANAANANAVKAADVRNTASTGAAGTANSNGNTNSGSGWFGGGKQSSAPYQQQPTAQHTVVRERSGGFMSGVLGFMLGHSLAQHSTQYVPVNQTGDTLDANGSPVPQQQAAPVENDESFAATLLRLVAWIAVIAGLVWLVRTVMGLRKSRTNKMPNYTL